MDFHFPSVFSYPSSMDGHGFLVQILPSSFRNTSKYCILGPTTTLTLFFKIVSSTKIKQKGGKKNYNKKPTCQNLFC